jgi:hypothetical protein
MSLMLALPPLLLGSRLPRKKGVQPFLLFFVAIGAGYILIEVALIQKFILFLGHPTYALAVIVFSMLVFSGIGSYIGLRETLLIGGIMYLAALALVHFSFGRRTSQRTEEPVALLKGTV